MPCPPSLSPTDSFKNPDEPIPPIPLHWAAPPVATRPTGSNMIIHALSTIYCNSVSRIQISSLAAKLALRAPTPAHREHWLGSPCGRTAYMGSPCGWVPPCGWGSQFPQGLSRQGSPWGVPVAGGPVETANCVSGIHCSISSTHIRTLQCSRNNPTNVAVVKAARAM